ncbi:MAG: hypothetical protein OQK75_13395 [Gammaproteobacteria bacterium]|nr:hypothetical protein [Gammaproteobacteria bacterium]MCW8988653.1 hypothetical protein [Gammaproteobacteria bacterium]
MDYLRFPIEEYFLEDSIEENDKEYTHLNKKLLQGLPQKIELDAEVYLYLVIPNGTANTWRDEDPKQVLSRGVDELKDYNVNEVEEHISGYGIHARLLVMRNSEVKASIPLVKGLRAVVDASTTSAPKLIELMINDWDLRTGLLRDKSDYGAWIKISWKKNEKAVEKFSTPPINTYVITRLKPVYRMESRLGLKKIKVMPRFGYKQNKIKEVQ